MAYRQCVGDACVSDDDCWGGADWFFIGYGTDQSIQLQSDTISAKDVGVRLFTGYVLLVEVAAFLLLGHWLRHIIWVKST